MKTSTFALGSEIKHLKRSEMRKLVGLAASPDIISLAAGLPSGEHIPVDDFKDCIASVLDRDGPRALQYGPPHEPLRRWIADFMTGRGVTCTP